MTYDVIVIGGGMAGMTACLYCLRNNKKVLLLEKETIGGQIAESPRVENFPTEKSISGTELADKLFDQISDLGVELEIEDAKGIEKKDGLFTVLGEYNSYQGRSVILATGAHHRALGLENEEKFIGSGIYYCAICDGPFFKDKPVTLIGDANTAMQYALMLSQICSKVDMFTLTNKLFGEKSLQDAVLNSKNIQVTRNVQAVALSGKNGLESITFRRTDGSIFEHKTNAAFVAIGQVPNNGAFKNFVDLSRDGYILSDEACLTKTEGLFVAGDCRTKKLRQVTTAIADGAEAATAAVNYLNSLGE